MVAHKSWLEKLTLPKLHKLAILIGAPCSGTKAARIARIRETASHSNVSADKLRGPQDLSLLSIDMGIRNLAFAHITAPVNKSEGPNGFHRYGKPELQAWHRMSVPRSQDSAIEVTPLVTTRRGKQESQLSLEAPQDVATKESFEPIDYAAHAYNVIKHMLQEHQPNQILIERQRFRSGGHSAVQEWTIRVGVFEGMLYAVLKTLAEEKKLQFNVEPMQPSRVTRSWLEGVDTAGEKPSGRNMKKAKIALVGGMLEAQAAEAHFTVNKELQPLASAFISVWKKENKSKKLDRSTNNAGFGKLDDLADSLLQGLAWIDWQNSRWRFNALQEKAFNLDTT